MKNIDQIKVASILSYIYIAISIFVQLLYTPFLIRCLGKSEYGLYNTVYSIMSMLSLLSLGFNGGYIQYFAKYKSIDDDESIYKLNGLYLFLFSIIGVICLIIGLCISFSLRFIYSDGLNDIEYLILKKLMIILSINLSISMPMSVFQNIIIAHEKFTVIKFLSIIKTIINPIISIPILFLSKNKSINVVIVTVCTSLIVDIIYLYYSFFKLKIKFKFDGFSCDLFKNIFLYTIFIAMHLLADQINYNVDKIILGRFSGAEEIAIYSVGFNLFAAYAQIGLAINGLFTPKIHNIIENTKNDNVKLKNSLTSLFIKVGRIQFIIVSLIATGFLFFGKVFINYWAGDGYEKSYYVALVLMFSGLIDIIQNIGIEMQRAQNLHKFRAYIYLFMALINIIISIYLVKKYGAIGSAIGTAISFLVVQGLIINIYLNKKCNIDIKIFWKNIIRMSFGLIIPLLLGCFFINIKINSLLMLFVCILIYSIVYCLSFYFISLNNYEKELIKSTITKVFKIKHNKNKTKI